MFELFVPIAEGLGELLNFLGVMIIVGGIIFSLVHFLTNAFAKEDIHKQYRSFRHSMARSILLGLELLLAGDIIRSVTGTPTIESILILGLIVLIRSFLGITFEMEVEGKWPWNRGKASNL